MEIIRFYYAISTDLSHATFSGTFELNPDSIVNTERSKYCEKENRLYLGLRQHITDEDGWVIARNLISKVARTTVNKIYEMILQSSINGKIIHIPAFFPFIGKSTLKARVRPIPAKNKSGWRLLVLSLLSCSARMPYSGLTIIRDNDGTKANPKTDIPESEKKEYQRPKTSGNQGSKAALQSRTDTNKSLSTVDFLVPSARFSALSGRIPDKPTKDFTKYKNARGFFDQVNIENYGIGRGGYGKTEKNTQRGKARSSNCKRLSVGASFALFKESIKILDKMKGVSASIRTLPLNLSYMPLTRDSRYWQWGYLNSSSSTRRYIIVADISIKDQFFNLIEFEHRENQPHSAGFIYTGKSLIEDTELKNLMFLCSIEKGVWKNVELTGIQVIPLKHTWPDAKSFSVSANKKMLGWTGVI